ncbi:glycine/sarcosine/betaine reductase complex component C subunit beta [Clostridium aceticum]|uniref:Glycine/sarcosine/betaine reductase complex component C subunit beta n=2 Tax=Clostridium aceticum TaxID=84022 RepID=A0A0G3W7P5_9CLOT|nr:glycine/sarcosine/betaine reductase complex component C subunit beta [Clostridium aceticum]AKL94696.1 glycine/sarcosine/betaine reductase complex component C subunit beta [Clostridium aceticum]
MSYAVVKGSSYVLMHTPDMIMHNGTTQTTEKQSNPNSEYLQKLPNHLRSYEAVVNYPPNQVYIGKLKPEELKNYDMPWYDKAVEGADRYGKFGEIMPQAEFIALLKIVDAFDLVMLEKNFTTKVREELKKHPLMKESLIAKLKEGNDIEEINKAIKEFHAEAIYHENQLIGCVKRAHELDTNLNAHIMYENLVAKASGVLAFLHLLDKNNIEASTIDYVIECSEEACGDMNQRGGGNFAKSIAEMAEAVNATGSDTRGFCAAPTHALIEAAALVKAGVFENVVIVAGGATAKLGMNGKDHVKKDMPILEDIIGGFAVLVSKNDGINPILRTDLLGRHTVGTGSSPQAVITSLITAPLDRGGLKITDIDKYSVEMQNPDVTKPAGAGDVPEANYKMIAALGVKRGELDRKEVATFGEKHGMPGWAPTQGHIPSGVPYIGHAREAFLNKEINRAMIVGKGSLFLGRMTNQFDGVSIVMEQNNGQGEATVGVSEGEVKNMIAEAMRNFATHLLGE